LFEENLRLKNLLKAIPGKDKSYITAHVVSYPGKPFVKTLLLKGGTDQGIYSEQPVLTEEGLVGRVIDSGRSSSHVLLITDMNSKIPVLLRSTGEHAIVSGNNTDLLSLKYVSEEYPIKIGEIIVTSGKGGVFPLGIPVGKVINIGEEIKVLPFSPLNKLSFVMIWASESPQLQETFEKSISGN
jgi:rod shape-determining protein MreC